MEGMKNHTFLHRHPNMETMLNIDLGHVIVDMADWQQAIKEHDELMAIRLLQSSLRAKYKEERDEMQRNINTKKEVF